MSYQVRDNLRYYNKWRDVTCHDSPGLEILSGVPPLPILPGDDSALTLWVVVTRAVSQPRLDPATISQWFAAVHQLAGTRPSRITSAIVAADGTVVYYTVHDGIVPPNQN